MIYGQPGQNCFLNLAEPAWNTKTCNKYTKFGMNGFSSIISHP